MIEFAYYSEHGERRDNAPMRFGEGLTSRIMQTREPMLLNRAEAFEETGSHAVGTPVKSYLGVPIIAGRDAIGVVSVQSMEQRVGSARPIRGSCRRSRRTWAPPSRTPASTRRPGVARARWRRWPSSGRRSAASSSSTRSSGRSPSARWSCSRPTTSAVFLEERGGERFLPAVALGELSEALLQDSITPGEGIMGDLAPAPRRRGRERRRGRSRGPSTSRGPARTREERLMAAPLLARGRVDRHDGASGGTRRRACSPRRTSTSSSACRSRRRSRSRVRACSRPRGSRSSTSSRWWRSARWRWSRWTANRSCPAGTPPRLGSSDTRPTRRSVGTSTRSSCPRSSCRRAMRSCARRPTRAGPICCLGGGRRTAERSRSRSTWSRSSSTANARGTTRSTTT